MNDSIPAIVQETAPGRLYAWGVTPESGRTKRVEEPSVRPALRLLDLSLLRDLQRVIYFDPKVSNRAFQLGMTEQDLDGP